MADSSNSPADYAGQNVTVVGLARSGVGAANLLAARGADVTVTDMKPLSGLSEYASMLSEKVKKVFGSHPDELFTKAGLVVVSPGVPLAIEPIRKAMAAGVPVIGELELAYRVSDSKFIAITGSNGKSTTTTLVGLMLKRAGMDVLVGGNIGNALTEDPAALMGRDYIVAEVSSFQLEAVAEFRPRVAAMLNITPDHMDRYPSMDAYAEAKARVCMNQTKDDALVYNFEDGLSVSVSVRAESNKVAFSGARTLDAGVYVSGGVMYDGRDPVNRREIMPVSDIAIKGAHNLENALAAAAVSLEAGADVNAIVSVLCEFKGLEHRLEFVAEIDGVSYYNDSKGTNVGAVMKSLESFDSPVILIAGGLDKHGEFEQLIPLVRERVKKLILIGDAAGIIETALGKYTDTVRAVSMREAVAVARQSAERGDVVLLSPACASFDMFDNFEHRGQVFKDAVGSLGDGD